MTSTLYAVIPVTIVLVNLNLVNIVTIQIQDNFHKFANHACMNEHNFENFFGEVTTMSK